MHHCALCIRLIRPLCIQNVGLGPKSENGAFRAVFPRSCACPGLWILAHGVNLRTCRMQLGVGTCCHMPQWMLCGLMGWRLHRINFWGVVVALFISAIMREQQRAFALDSKHEENKAGLSRCKSVVANSIKMSLKLTWSINAEVCLARTASAHCKVWHLSSFKPLAVMKLTNIVIVLALACVPVQSDDFAKNLRGESAVGVPEKEQDVTAQKESTDEEVGAVLAELDTSAEATEGVDEQERAARVCKRWVTCTNGFFGGIRCSGGRHCTLWQRWAFWPVLNSLDAQQSSASFVAGGREIYRNLLLWPANFTATTGGHLLSLNEPCLHQLRCWLNSSGRTLWVL